MPMKNNNVELTREDLKIVPESPTMELSKTPAVEPSDQTQAAKLVPLVYRVDEIAQLLAISNRAAYNLCNTTKDFKVIRLGTSIRVSKQSFDDWFAAV
ncbi:MAG: helix-turn-helix domain-containing protein [Faecalibacterium prausnitzii]